MERSSYQLRELQDRLRAVESEIIAGEEQLASCNSELGRLRDRLQDCQRRALEREKQVLAFLEYDHNRAAEEFAEIAAALPPVTMNNADQLAHSAHQTLQGRINQEQGKVNETAENMLPPYAVSKTRIFLATGNDLNTT